MRILILGANGMIGHKLYQKISLEYKDTWVTLRNNFNDYSYNFIYDSNKVIDNLDLRDFKKLNLKLNQLKPNLIINACGITIRRGIDNIVSDSILINSALPNFLNEWVINNNQRLIHFSTDCVFSGKKGNYTEDDIPDANDLYGKTKALGEIKFSINTITLRGSMIGRELENKTELLEWLLNQKNKRINGFANVIYSGITTTKMAEIVLLLINSYPNLNGLYNISSKSISKFNLLNLLNTTFKTKLDIQEVYTNSSNKNLISDKFFTDINLRQPSWNDLIVELVEDSHNFSNLYT